MDELEVFTYEDFGTEPGILSPYTTYQCAQITNLKLKSLLGPMVYQYNSSGHGDWSETIDEEYGGIRKYSKQAFLINIQPLVQGHECKPKELYGTVCETCWASLRPVKWEKRNR